MNSFLFPPRRTRLALVAAAALLGAASAPAQDPAQSPAPAAATTPQPRQLVTGKSISVKASVARQNVGSLPVNLITTTDGQYVLTTDAGFRQSVWVTRTSDGIGVTNVDFSNAPINYSGDPASRGVNGLYYGLATSADGTVYAAGGGSDAIAVFRLDLATGRIPATNNGNLFAAPTFATKAGDFPTGLALDGNGRLYVANNDPGDFSKPCSVAIYDTTPYGGDLTKVGQIKELGRYTFAAPPNFPLAVAALSTGAKVYVSTQRDGTVVVLNTANPAAPTLATTITTGAHPIALLLNRNQSRLFVANAHSDTVSIVDTTQDTVIGTATLRPSQAGGQTAVSTPTGLALSADESTLYVTLGDANAVGVVDVTAPTAPAVRGYLPAGWYPTGVALSPDGTALLVANAKGTRTRYPNPGYLQFVFNASADYDLNLVEGQVTRLPLPDAAGLAAATKKVVANNARQLGVDLTSIGLASGKITHVIYIVKENRTYDQVFGDLTRGNGDPSLALFNNDVTPNQHALAQRFVLLDNFYVCAEASGDGWPWSTQGIASEYVIKNLPYNYSGRGRQYDFEGQNNGYPAGGFPATDPDGNALSAAFPNGAPAIVDVSEAPGGHIWDAVQKAGLSYRNYGFFCNFGVTVSGVTVIPDNYPAAAGLQPAGHDLAGITDVDFRRYDAAYADSDAPSANNVPDKLATYGKYNAVSRFSEFKREFNEMLAKDATGAAVPAFITLRYMHDHTQGFSPGAPSPRAQVADNDYAIGQTVELISNSPIWKHTAIFIIEDDAQDGPDHVDCHRSPCLVISPHVRRAAVDHNFYNTDSVLRAIEELLGVPALSSYDRIAAAVAGTAFRSGTVNAKPFAAIAPTAAIISEKVPTLAHLRHGDPRRALARMSLQMNFDRPDCAPAQQLNEVIWKSVRGVDSPVPASQHQVIVRHAPAPAPADAAGRPVRRRDADGDDDDEG